MFYLIIMMITMMIITIVITLIIKDLPRKKKMVINLELNKCLYIIGVL